MAKTSTQLVEPASGRILAEHLDRPRTFIGRGIGLMFRSSLPAGRGMLIDPCNGIHMLFMQFAIDAVFLDPRNRIRRIYRRVPPWSGVVWLVWGARKVVELPAGTLDDVQLEVGDPLELRSVPAA